jgi:hypothetical protein
MIQKSHMGLVNQSFVTFGKLSYGQQEEWLHIIYALLTVCWTALALSFLGLTPVFM